MRRRKWVNASLEVQVEIHVYVNSPPHPTSTPTHPPPPSPHLPDLAFSPGGGDVSQQALASALPLGCTQVCRPGIRRLLRVTFLTSSARFYQPRGKDLVPRRSHGGPQDLLYDL